MSSVNEISRYPPHTNVEVLILCSKRRIFRFCVIVFSVLTF